MADKAAGRWWSDRERRAAAAQGIVEGLAVSLPLAVGMILFWRW